jgi:hypothetical protein
VTALTIWSLTKRFWPYLLGAGALIAAYLLIDHTAYQRGSHDRDAEVIRITADRDTAVSNAGMLQTALDEQNTAIAKLKADSDKRTAEGKAALAAAQKANAGLASQAEALRKSAGVSHAAGDPCTISKTLAGAKL